VCSVLSQSWRDFEFVVVDGGSTDGSAAYLEKISGELAWWISEKDSGVYEAMNKAIDKASGDYFLFLNSGDRLTSPTILEQVVPELGETDLVYGNLQVQGKKETLVYSDQLDMGTVWNHSLPHPATFIRKNLFDQVGKYNETDRITSDWQFFMSALFQHQATYRHINRFIASIEEGGLSRSKGSMEKIRLEKEAFARKYPDLNGYRPCFLILADFPPNGGSKAYFFSIVHYLLQKKATLRVILAGEQTLSGEERDWFKSQGIGVSFIPVRFTSGSHWIRKLRLDAFFEFRYLRHNRGRYDKVIVSTNKPYVWLTGAWVWGSKFYYLIHSYPQGKPSWKTRLVAPLRRVWFRSMASRGYTFITVSNAAKRRLRNQYYLREQDLPVTVIPGPGKFFDVVPAQRDHKSVLTLGHLEKWKNPGFWIQVAVEVLKEVPDASFVWAGTGSLEPAVRQKIPDEYRDRILLPGFIENVEELYQQTAVYFQPSLAESQGFGVIDAMAFSLPSVVSDRGGLPESVEEGINGFVVEFNVNRAASRIIQLLNDHDLRNRMGEAGRKRFNRLFTLAVWEQRMDATLFNGKNA